MKNRIVRSILLAAVCGSIATVPKAANKTITIKGSDTMVILGQRWAEEYMQ